LSYESQCVIEFGGTDYTKYKYGTHEGDLLGYDAENPHCLKKINIIKSGLLKNGLDYPMRPFKLSIQ
jgi:hypothetical protein